MASASTSRPSSGNCAEATSRRLLGGHRFVLQRGDATPQDLRRPERRRDLDQPRETQRILPTLAHRARALVLGPRGCALAGEPVVRVEPEQPPVAVHPGHRVVDEHGCPGVLLARADGLAVAACVVDEGHAQGARQARRQVARIGLPQRVAPEVAQRVQETGHATQGRDGHEGHVLALLEVGGVRARPSEEHRVVAVLDQRRVVPAPAQVVAVVVVSGGRDPHRPRPLGSVLEVDEDLLPVRLVVVRTAKGRAVVVHEVEERVVQHDPAVAPHDAPVVDVARVGGAHALVLDRRRGGRAARDRAPQQQRGREAGVHEAREEAHPRQPAGRPEAWSFGAARPALQIATVERLLDQPQEERFVRRRHLRRQQVRRQLSDRDQQPPLLL